MVKLLQLANQLGNAEQVFELQCTVIILYANGIMAEGTEAELKSDCRCKETI